MNTESIKQYCLLKSGSYEDHPFGEWPVCIKVRGKIFAQIYPDKVTLKCTAFSGEAFRAAWPGIVTRGYHCPPVQQPYWNTINLSQFPREEMPVMLDHAYDTVFSSLPKIVQQEIVREHTV